MGSIRRMILFFILLIFMPTSDYQSISVSINPPNFEPVHWLAIGANDSDLKIIRDSLQAWNLHFKKNIFIEVTANQDWTILEEPFDININGTYVVGYTDVFNKNMYLFNIWHTNTDIGEINVVAHEAGHILGYHHVNYPN